MQDRVPTAGQEGRVLITPENGGAAYYAKIQMADNPTQDGTPLNKSTLLQDITCDTIGIDRASTPNEAFLALALGIGQYGYVITVLLPDGSPAAGLSLTGAEAPSGEAPVTDTRGVAIAVSNATSITVNVASPYIDVLDSGSMTIQSEGTLTYKTIQLQISGELDISTSITKKTSPCLDTFDLCAVGAGGGSGGCTGTNAALNTNKPGGGGGYVENLLSIVSIPEQSISFEIGSGGAAGITTPGGTGGNTNVSYGDNIILSAAGGNGGSVQQSGGSPAAGGAGNGIGGSGSMNTMYGTNGSDGTGFKFNDASLGVAGGGGGGGGRALGGNPYGGDGANYPSRPTASTPGPGGGGGGGNNGGDSASQVGSAGGNGIVYFRPHYKNE